MTHLCTSCPLLDWGLGFEDVIQVNPYGNSPRNSTILVAIPEEKGERGARKSFSGSYASIRTGNRHRWIGRVDQGERESIR